MLPSGLSWKLFLVISGSNLLMALAVAVTVPHWQHVGATRRSEAMLHAAASVFRQRVVEHLDHHDPPTSPQLEASAELHALLRNAAADAALRFTLIDSAGVVLADSEQDPRHMLNHGNRPELADARRSGMGTAVRRSPTLGYELLYVAIPIERNTELIGFLRAATPTSGLRHESAAFRRAVWLLVFFIAILGAAAAYLVILRSMHPLAQLTRSVQEIAYGGKGRDHEILWLTQQDETGQLAAAFRQIQQQLNRELSELRAHNEQLGTVLSSMSEGIIAVDSSERILLANQACRSLLGFVRGDAVGRPLLEASRNRPLHEVVRECLERGRPASAEFESLSQPRRSFSVQATCLPGDPCPGAVVLLHDTTELRRLENLRREFVANVSHELKTPLAAIKAYAETLRLGAVNDKEHNLGFVSRIEEQANRLHELIVDMLQIARVETGREAFEIVDVPLQRVVEASVAQHAGAADLKSIQLAAELPPSPISVAADEQGLRSIVDNLVDNAIKYTPERGTVTVRWTIAGAFAEIEVQDTGIGIATEDQARVFERFFRSDKARSRELGGTGLGLAIVKHLSIAFGGSVELRSQLGAGSCFLVRIPLGSAG